MFQFFCHPCIIQCGALLTNITKNKIFTLIFLIIVDHLGSSKKDTMDWIAY